MNDNVMSENKQTKREKEKKPKKESEVRSRYKKLPNEEG